MKFSALAAFGAAAALAGAPAVAAREIVPELRPLAFLVGSCWTGSFPNGNTDTHCFTPLFDGRFIRDVHVVRGDERPYAGETTYRWDAAKSAIRFTYVSLPGGYSEGEAQPGAAAIMFPDEHVAADGTRRKIQTIWTPEGADAYHVLSRIEDGQGGWREMLNMRMTRAGPATPLPQAAP